MPSRYAPFGKEAQRIRRNDTNRPKGTIPRTHPPFKFTYRPVPKFLFVYPQRNPSQKYVRAPAYSFAGANIALQPIHDKRRAVLKRKLRKRPKKKVKTAKRVRFARNTKR